MFQILPHQLLFWVATANAVTGTASPSCPTKDTPCGDLNFKATFGATPRPFKIQVDPEFIRITKLKASLTRYTTDINQPDFVDGPPRHNISTIRDYWVNEYDWYSIEQEINQNLTQYTTTVYADGNYTHPIPLHFVHHRSNRSDAIPLLFIHGWPGSFLEVGKMINNLTNPPNDSLPAFHIVAPSLPGFGFSPVPAYPGLGLREAGQAFENLMTKQLNYPKFVIQGGDFGGFTLRYMAGDFPDIAVSALSNFFIIPPNATDMARYEAGTTIAEENLNIEELTVFQNDYAGYRDIQQTRPLQLAVGMTDCPVVFAAWIYDFMFLHVNEYPWTPKEIITWAMMYYIQGPYAGFAMYKELARARVGTWLNEGFRFLPQPLAISAFPKDGFRTPSSWVEKYANLSMYTDNTKGGHFAAYEVPDLLVGNIRAFWGNNSLSNADQLGLKY
ncbi:related to epoxide hydrolase [Phialocephala subalpina]|uniref:Related to epoxide hydrolase n=1 Tax=Phialocephala subalpina TaxID=576137 RepID=A0A1L7X9R5_9HELO|nr:related to epoxide hydrolase [Phialocephala subalpina]